MITSEQALQIMREYLKMRERNPSSIDERIFYSENKEVLYGLRQGQHRDVYTGSYGEIWGLEERSMFVFIDAETGKVLYSTSPHGCIEVSLDEEFEE